MVACWFVDATTIGLLFDGDLTPLAVSGSDFAAVFPTPEIAGITLLMDGSNTALLCVFANTGLIGDLSEIFTATLLCADWNPTGNILSTPKQWTYFGSPPPAMLLAGKEAALRLAAERIPK